MAFVLILAVWLGRSVSSARVQRRAVAAIQKAGGTVKYDSELKNLKFLNLVETPVTDAAVKDLQMALPTLKIVRSAR